MSFIDELKQRKVFRVATVYLVVAWVAVQAASIALPAFDAPPWMLRVVILLIALGFPFALVLAWALDVTPQGLRFSAGGTGTKRIGVVAALLVVLALVWFFRGAPALHPAEKATTAVQAPITVASAPADARSVAVLPFVNMSGDPANEYFSDGVAETTLDMLAQVPDLKVVARTSSFAFKGKAEDVRKIGAALGAATLLEGSVQRAGNAVRVTAQLVKAADGTHLWSKHFDRQLADVFKIEDEVATEVVHALQVSLPADDQQRLTQKRTDSVDAYQEYLRGMALLPGRKVDEMREAAQHFERAISLDPDYARAYVAAHDTYELLSEYGTVSEAEKERAEHYVDRALALAPDLGEAHASRATQLERRHDLHGAETEYERAIELAPSYATAYQWYGELLQYRVHDFARAERLMRRATELDPLSAIMQDQAIYPLMALNRFDEAQAALDKLQRAHPDFAEGYFTQAMLGISRVDLVAALRGYREIAAHDPGALGRFRDRCWALLRFSATNEALACNADLAARWPGAAELKRDRLQIEFDVGRIGPQAVLDRAQQDKIDLDTFQVYLLYLLNRDDEALALLHKLMPRLFDDPPPTLYFSELPPATLAGALLLRGAAPPQGRALLHKALETLRAHVANPAADQAPWLDVALLTLLGDSGAALTVLEQRLASGCVIDLIDLDHDPIFAALRADPRFEKAMAPARAKAAAQVRAAHDAGLL